MKFPGALKPVPLYYSFGTAKVNSRRYRDDNAIMSLGSMPRLSRQAILGSCSTPPLSPPATTPGAGSLGLAGHRGGLLRNSQTRGDHRAVVDQVTTNKVRCTAPVPMTMLPKGHRQLSSAVYCGWLGWRGWRLYSLNVVAYAHLKRPIQYAMACRIDKTVKSVLHP